MKRFALLFVAVTLAGLAGCGKNAGAAAQHPWAKFKVGSYAKTRISSAMNVAGRPINTTIEMKQTLVELTAAHAVVEIETTAMGKSTKTKREIPLSVTGDAGSVPGVDAFPGGASAFKSGKVLGKGTETITVAGKSIKCTWTETSVTQGANEGKGKFYVSEQMPGMMVKSTFKITGGMNSESTHEVIEFLAK
jgi:hypothetical protein